MIIKQDKSFETHSGFPNTNWYVDEQNYIIDETMSEGKLMAQMYIDNYPFVDFEYDGEFITKVIVLDKPERPLEVEGKEIQLIQNEQGEWEYIYVDLPIDDTDLQARVNELEAMINLLVGGGEDDI